VRIGKRTVQYLDHAVGALRPSSGAKGRAILVSRVRARRVRYVRLSDDGRRITGFFRAIPGVGRSSSESLEEKLIGPSRDARRHRLRLSAPPRGGEAPGLERYGVSPRRIWQVHKPD